MAIKHGSTHLVQVPIWSRVGSSCHSLLQLGSEPYQGWALGAPASTCSGGTACTYHLGTSRIRTANRCQQDWLLLAGHFTFRIKSSKKFPFLFLKGGNSRGCLGKRVQELSIWRKTGSYFSTCRSLSKQSNKSQTLRQVELLENFHIRAFTASYHFLLGRLHS